MVFLKRAKEKKVESHWLVLAPSLLVILIAGSSATVVVVVVGQRSRHETYSCRLRVKNSLYVEVSCLRDGRGLSEHKI